MQPHQQRVVDERAELDKKIAALEAFMEGSIFASLDDAEQVRLTRQVEVMHGYSDILGERISNF